MAPTPRRDFRRTPRRSRFEARALRAGEATDHAVAGGHKQRLIGPLRGTVVELGPGTGVNMRYYGPDVRVIAVEPNPAMHPLLRESAAAHGVDLDLHEAHAEDLDLPAGSADAVVATLVLCGVDDAAAAVAQVRRVLRPGGTFVTYEHVRAPAGTATRLGQRLAKRPQRWLLNGCEVDRDTGAVLAAAGFSSLDLQPVDAGPGAVWTRTRLIGTATR